MTELLDFLEPFDAPTADLEPDGPIQDQPGFQEGVAAGLEQAQHEQTTLRSELAQKLTEVSFSYAEAKLDILSSLTRFLEVLGHQVLPELSQDIERSHLIACLKTAAENHATPPVVIKAPESDIPALEAAIPDPPPIPIRVEPTSGLSGGQRLIAADGQEQLIDVPALIEALRDILDSMRLSHEEETKHEQR